MIKPDKTNWEGTRDYLFIVSRESVADWTKHPSPRSVNSGCTFINGAMVKFFSQMMKTIVLSTTKAELNAAVLTAMDMLLAYYILVSLKLTVKLPMMLHVDNKGAFDLANNWPVAGRTRHMGTKQNFLCELKANGVIEVKHKSGTELLPDIRTKNVQNIYLTKQSDKIMHPALKDILK